MKQYMQPTLFDITEALQENKDYLEQKAQEQRDLFYSSLPRPCEEPKDDNEQMLLAQWQWLRNHDEEARKRFFLMGYEVLRRILWAEKKKRKLYMTDEQDMDAISTAFEYVFRRYSKGKGYYVSKNMIVILKGGIQHALDYRTKADDEISLDSFKGDYTKKIKRFF